MRIEGLHHVTAVTGNPSLNVAFYTEVLGMRLVKKTVNQDDVSAYHLFYGDEAGHAGTELTFFDWPWAADARQGTGSVSRTSFRVNDARALGAWERRLGEFRVPWTRISKSDGRSAIEFADPEGQPLELVEGEGTAGGIPWPRSTVPAEMGIRGLSAVHIPVIRPEPTAVLLTQVMGFRLARENREPNGSHVFVYETGSGGPGAEVHLIQASGTARGTVGIGGVHHVAFRTPNDAEHSAWQRRLASAGVPASPIIDRFYFHSIYFREPGGVLFEIATDGPGFASDEDMERLGEKLSLPPFLEPRRKEIEAGLKPISTMSLAPSR
jgi:glyoxalase family protein